jgi:hypothetical protein
LFIYSLGQSLKRTSSADWFVLEIVADNYDHLHEAPTRFYAVAISLAVLASNSSTLLASCHVGNAVQSFEVCVVMNGGSECCNIGGGWIQALFLQDVFSQYIFTAYLYVHVVDVDLP